MFPTCVVPLLAVAIPLAKIFLLHAALARPCLVISETEFSVRPGLIPAS